MGTYSFTVATYCYVVVKRGRLGGERRFGAHRGRKKGRGHIVAAPALLVIIIIISYVCVLHMCVSGMWSGQLFK